MLLPTLRQSPEADFPRPRNPVEANRQDLAFIRTYGDWNRSFDSQSRDAFFHEIDALDRRAATLDRAALEMGIAHAVAHAGDAHSNLRGAGYGLSLNSLPIRLAWFREGLFVVKASPAQADLLGARVISEEGRTPEAIFARLRPYMGGPASFLREHQPHFMISPEALHAIGLSASPVRSQFRFALEDGRRIDRVIPADPDSANGPRGRSDEFNTRRQNRWPRRELSPLPFPGDDRPWIHVLDSHQALPLYLARPDRFYWHSYRENPRALYLQINAGEDEPGQVPLDRFLDNVLVELKNHPIRNAIVDLRFNPGGNAERIISFTEKLPKLVPPGGRIYILTSGNTFSAGIIAAARLKYFGGKRAIIIGERIGDNERFWAEGQDFVLPNSGILVKSTAAYHDWYNGCKITQISYCYLFNYMWGVPAGNLWPAIPVKTSFRDYMAGRDSVMEVIDRLTPSSGRDR